MCSITSTVNKYNFIDDTDFNIAYSDFFCGKFLNDSGKIIGTHDKAVECEVCDRWFHMKCQGAIQEKYRNSLVL